MADGFVKRRAGTRLSCSLHAPFKEREDLRPATSATRSTDRHSLHGDSESPLIEAHSVSLSEKVVTIFLIEREAGELNAWRRSFASVFPKTTFIACRDLVEAVAKRLPAEVEILLLGDVSEADRAGAINQLDDEELPRWPVFEPGTGDVEAGRIGLPPEEAESPRTAALIQLGVDRFLWQRQAAKMAGDLQTIGSRMCHDLRTPLSCLQTFVYIAEASHSSEIPEELMASASASTEELALLIDRLSVIGKSWAVTAANDTVDVQEAFNRAWHRVARRFPDQELQLDLPSSFPVVAGHADWVETVWHICLAEIMQGARGGAGTKLSWQREASGAFRFDFLIPGMEERDWALEPFHLLSTRRDRGNVASALVQRLVRRMGGSCGSGHAPEGFVRFHFSLRPAS